MKKIFILGICAFFLMADGSFALESDKFSDKENSQLPFMTLEMIDVSGRIVVDGGNAETGTVVEAFDPQGTLCGRFEVQSPGILGITAISRDDPDTPDIDEGAVPGDHITFRIDGEPAVVMSDRPVIWTEDGDDYDIDLLIGQPDTTGPEVVGVKTLSPIHLMVAFNETVDSATGGNPTNYVLEDSSGNTIRIYEAKLHKNPTIVILNTNTLSRDMTYFLTVKENIADLWGNITGKTDRTFLVTFQK